VEDFRRAFLEASGFLGSRLVLELIKLGEQGRVRGLELLDLREGGGSYSGFEFRFTQALFSVAEPVWLVSPQGVRKRLFPNAHALGIAITDGPPVLPPSWTLFYAVYSKSGEDEGEALLVPEGEGYAVKGASVPEPVWEAVKAL